MIANEDQILFLLEENLDVVVQRASDPLYFDFLFKPGYPKSEAMKVWFELHDVSYFVAEWGPLGGVEHAGVSFRDRPDLAMLFKLTFA